MALATPYAFDRSGVLGLTIPSVLCFVMSALTTITLSVLFSSNEYDNCFSPKPVKDTSSPDVKDGPTGRFGLKCI